VVASLPAFTVYLWSVGVVANPPPSPLAGLHNVRPSVGRSVAYARIPAPALQTQTVRRPSAVARRPVGASRPRPETPRSRATQADAKPPSPRRASDIAL
jgi:hypothetical protein